MRLQVAHPAEHGAIASLPFRAPLADWKMDNVHRVLGLHRHVVQLIEFGDVSYVVKELPDQLAEREYRLLREIDEAGLPTVEVVGVLTGRPEQDGMLITRHLDYSLPYRSLLMGRGLQIPYLGERVLDALVAQPVDDDCAYSWHNSGAQFAFADGSVHFLGDDIEWITYQNLGDRRDGQVLGSFE